MNERVNLINQKAYAKNASYGINFTSFGKRQLGSEPNAKEDDTNWDKASTPTSESILLMYGGRLSSVIFLGDSTPLDLVPSDQLGLLDGGHSYMIQFGNVYPVKVGPVAGFFSTNVCHDYKANFVMGDAHVETLSFNQFFPEVTGYTWDKCKVRPQWKSWKPNKLEILVGPTG